MTTPNEHDDVATNNTDADPVDSLDLSDPAAIPALVAEIKARGENAIKYRDARDNANTPVMAEKYNTMLTNNNLIAADLIKVLSEAIEHQ